MRKEFFFVKSRSTAIRLAPWAARIVKVDGGYLAFASADEARIWKNQR